MDEASVDLCDRRGRLRRLLVACTIGGGATAGLLSAINAVSAKPNSDALSQATPALLGIAMFVMTSWLALAVIDKIRQRRAS